ncbi:hypothetical protein [Pyrococcus abyssi]|uniref:ScoMcrA-like N-terminal head domain-containing protein n=1 Tax=Pyrococcus abyssi (strain GE5 / Orsay) TaxID=272844 RepID=Q9UYD9_PYRAB|nr:hypothetical protein [Pyrococcus abyssi]CAB50473.1 Hypothetical protein PAB1036 [Pyrococcus abyssi GE5]CCE71024.1 TPA: hypothetical protein PAB1036 [Pyrococcus abyssi GE5]
MSIPKNISREDVLKALEEIDRKGIPKKFKAISYFLVYNGRRYPTKYVISLANKYANGRFLDPVEFNTYSAVRYLKKLGFQVERSEKSQDDFSPIEPMVLVEEYPPQEFDEKMYSIFERFASLIEERFRAIVEKRSELNEIYQESEDTIRYMMFYALTTFGEVDPLDVYLEYPHPEVPKINYAKLDTFIAGKEDRPALAFEMKFKTRIPSRKNIPESQIAGSAFADLLRLALFKLNSEKEVKRYFVYIVDNEMIGYYRNPTNKLKEFFDLEINRGFKLARDYILFKDKERKKKRAKSLIKAVVSNIGEPENWPEPRIICRFKRDLSFKGTKIAIRIYEVVP